MPVYLRNFYYKKLIEAKQRESEQAKQASKPSKSGKIDRPSF